MVKPGLLCIVRTMTDAFATVNAELFDDVRFSVPDTDRLCGTGFDTGDASAALVGVQINGMEKLLIMIAVMEQLLMSI